MNSLTRLVSRNFFGGAALLLLTGPGWAGSTSDRGTSSGMFLKIPVSARMAAMGGAVTAVTGEAGVLTWNPAGLADSDNRQVLLSHAPSPEGTSFSNAYYVHPSGVGAWGAGVTYFSAGSIDETEETVGATVGTFRPTDAAATLGYAQQFAGWNWGVAVKGVQSKIVESDSTLAFDGGILTPAVWQERIRFGASVLNSGGTLRLGETSRPLPLQFAAGMAFAPHTGWILAADVKFPRDNDPFFCVGGEADYLVGDDWHFAGRAGWEGAMESDLGDFSGLNAGIGFSKGAMGVDYAISPMGNLGESHRISLTFSY